MALLLHMCTMISKMSLTSLPKSFQFTTMFSEFSNGLKFCIQNRRALTTLAIQKIRFIR